MEQISESETAEFCRLTEDIRNQINSLKKMILTEEEKDEQSKILQNFDDAIRSQVLGTLEHLMIYQISGWRELADEGNN